MPKLTQTGWEIGSSEAGAIVLMQTAFQDRNSILRKHKLARANVDTIDQPPSWALKRGNHLEPAIASMAKQWIEERSGECHLWEPTEPYQKTEYGIASSIDRVVELTAPLTLNNYAGELVEFSGTGVCEIKSDKYHHGRPKPEWKIQVLHQLLCSDLDWGMIAVFDQNFNLSIYPVERDAHLIGIMIDAYAEFHELLNSADGEYPPIEHDEDEYVDLAADSMTASAESIAQMSADYDELRGRIRGLTKDKDKLQNSISCALDELNLTKVIADGWKIKLQTTLKKKRKSVETDEQYESESFTIRRLKQ